MTSLQDKVSNIESDRMTDTENVYQPYFPVRYGRTFLEWFHASSHLPWCAAIPAVTVLFRLSLTLPATIRAQRGRAKLIALKPMIAQAQREIPQMLQHRLRHSAPVKAGDRQKLIRHHVNLGNVSHHKQCSDEKGGRRKRSTANYSDITAQTCSLCNHLY